MSSNPLEYLKQGNISFLSKMSTYELNSLSELIRNSQDRFLIIDNILPLIKDTYSLFCLNLIYDIDKYEKETKYLLLKTGTILSKTQLINLLKNTKWGIYYIIEHSSNIFETISNDTINKIFYYLLKDHQDKIYIFKNHHNLHIRYLFIKYLILSKEDILFSIYDNILDYLTTPTILSNEEITISKELMSIEDISDLCYTIFKSKYKDIYYEPLKEYILNNYSNNDIASKLLNDSNSLDSLLAFKEDANRLFTTSRNFQFYIYKHYSSMLSQNILSNFIKYISYFKSFNEHRIESIFKHELGDKLIKYIDKYLSLSTRKDVVYLESGSTCCTYRFGDYCLKLIKTKWSFEDTICPNLYLIAKNYEEDYVRGIDGVVEAGLEIQKYYSRSARDVPSEIINLYTSQLKELGYYTTDSLVKGTCGDNCRLLDSYEQADCVNPEELPTWFKEYPMVLVDRDRVYKNENIFIKQLQSLE